MKNEALKKETSSFCAFIENPGKKAVERSN